MLNEEKIKIMNKLAMYEQGEGKKYLPVSKYYSELIQLNKIYGREEKKSSARGIPGGYKK